MATNPDDFALVIGIDDYPKFRSLEGAIRDATAFAAWLAEEPSGGGVDPANCRLILSRPVPARPIQDEIDQALEDILAAAGAAGRRRRFYLFFSGHGLAPSSFATDLCLAGWSELRRNLALDAMDYLKVIQDSGYFREIVAFIDCCRVRKVNAHGLPCSLGYSRPDEAGAARMFVAHATEVYTQAFEGPAEDGPTREVRGYFSRALLDGLRGAAAGPAGVTPTLLKRHLEREVPRLAALDHQTQKPDVSNGMLADPEPVFGGARPSGACQVTIRFQPGRAGPVVLEDADLAPLRSGAVGDGPWRLGLGPGLYGLRDDAANQTSTFRVGRGMEVLDVAF